MNLHIDKLKKSRKLTLKVIEGLTIEQLNKIPTGFSNNIIWNFCHVSLCFFINYKFRSM